MFRTSVSGRHSAIRCYGALRSALDPRFLTNPLRITNRGPLSDVIRGVLHGTTYRAKSLYDWIRRRSPTPGSMTWLDSGRIHS